MLKQTVSLLIALSFLAENVGWASSQNYTSRKKELLSSVYTKENADKVAAAVENKEQGAELVEDLLARNLRQYRETLRAQAAPTEPRAAKPAGAGVALKGTIPPASPLAPEDQVVLNDFVTLVQK